MKKFIILADILININDEYTRFIDEALVEVIEASSSQEALSKCSHQVGDDFQCGRIENLYVREV